jgi:penicillin-binding protein 1A
LQPQHHAFPSRRRISLPTWRRESAAKIGFQALALGASCTRIDELTRAFSAFARNGSLEEPVYLRRVRDRAGQVVEDNTAVSDPMGPPDVRLDRMVALAGQSTKTVIPPRAAWLTSQLLRRVVTKGHAPALRSTGLLVAGKTGTSSATMDTWFVGYTSRSMITTWIGDDRRERPLGYKDAAFMLNVPMAARFLWETTAGQPLRDIPWERPAGVRANDTGGNLRTTMEAGKPKTRPRRVSARGSGAKARPATGRLSRA